MAAAGINHLCTRPYYDVGPRLRIDSLCGGLRGVGQTQRLPRRDLSNSLEMDVLEHRTQLDVKLGSVFQDLHLVGFRPFRTAADCAQCHSSEP